MKEYRFYTHDELYGPAITYTRIDEHGRMWVGNGEYESQVNFCPMTGEAAPVQLAVGHIYDSGAEEYRDKSS